MTAVAYANKFANFINKRYGIDPKTYPYPPKVRNKREAREHGYMPGALATVTFEESDVDLIDLSAEFTYKFPNDEFWMECYASYMVGVYRK